MTMIPVATTDKVIFLTFFDALVLSPGARRGADPVLTDEAVFATPSGISIFFRLEHETVPCIVVALGASPVPTDEAVFASSLNNFIFSRLEHKTLPCTVAPGASPMLTEQAVFASPLDNSISFTPLGTSPVPIEAAVIASPLGTSTLPVGFVTSIAAHVAVAYALNSTAVSRRSGLHSQPRAERGTLRPLCLPP
jgi:hypothetical protein